MIITNVLHANHQIIPDPDVINQKIEDNAALIAEALRLYNEDNSNPFVDSEFMPSVSSLYPVNTVVLTDDEKSEQMNSEVEANAKQVCW